MRFGRLQLFNIFGIPIRLDYTWFIIFVLFTWSFASLSYPNAFPEWPRSFYWIAGISSALLLFFSVLLHELGHSFVALRSGVPIESITLFIFGGVAQMSKQPPDPKTELRIALAGPMVSFGLALCFSLAAYFVGGVPEAIFRRLAVANGALGIFNLVPGLPLDGGRVLRSILWKTRQDLVSATQASSRAGKAIAIGMIVLGFFGILLDNPVGIWTVLVGLFLLLAADAEYRHVRLRTLLAGVTVREIMRQNVVAVSPDLKIGTVVDEYFLKYHYKSFPVLDGTAFLGLITLADVKDVPRNEWYTSSVGEAMTPRSETATVHPEEDASDVFQKMLKAGLGLFHVDEGDRLVGILTRKDVIQLLRMKTDLGK